MDNEKKCYYLLFMTTKEALFLRHSVRSYKDEAITKDVINILTEEIDKLRFKSRLYIRLVTGDDKAFSGLLAKYGKFRNVKNYVVISGKKSDDLFERAGYFGQSLALFAQTLGLNSCFVAVTFSKKEVMKNVPEGNKLSLVLALGYGENQGVPHKNKPIEELAAIPSSAPEWYREGIEGALAAPTALNQQHFFIEYKDDKVILTNKGGICSLLDLGIVRYSFEVASGRNSDIWAR